MEKKTVLITGASRGIGKQLALAFSKNNWNVCGCYKNNAPEFEIQNSKFFKTDISNYKEVKDLIKNTTSEFGKIDCVINNASITSGATIFKMTDEMWNSVLKTDLSGTFYMVKESLKQMIKQRSGSIINIASIAAFKPYVGSASYSASKAGVIALTKTAAREGGRFGITVNAVLPGFHLSGMGGNSSDEYIDIVKKESVLNTTTDIKEFTNFIVFLSQVKTVSGQTFNFDSRLL
ncbi:SDR family oxidoreductase [Candidatus Endomicrobiellum devescovinae]|jgi:3-oxoacyl-[acyl-carrier protein] reductase|uniref:SDR family oxidoreductase n=1 Tax=Candidatus Endomicrobiellum devescovinae TaxID=3242322 RepID=UPI0028215714|nr:SDR family oxidoreductase [Endomicrobium sp.]